MLARVSGPFSSPRRKQTMSCSKASEVTWRMILLSNAVEVRMPTSDLKGGQKGHRHPLTQQNYIAIFHCQWIQSGADIHTHSKQREAPMIVPLNRDLRLHQLGLHDRHKEPLSHCFSQHCSRRLRVQDPRNVSLLQSHFDIKTLDVCNVSLVYIANCIILCFC